MNVGRTPRDGGSGGPAVDGLTVSVNGQELSYSAGSGAYSGVIPAVPAGDDLTVSVSDGLGTVSRTAQVPHEAANVALQGGAWDTSGAAAENTLTWDNPVVLGEALGVFVYDQYSRDVSCVYELYDGDPEDETLTISNSELSYYDLESAICLVGQVNYVDFEDNPGDSRVMVFAGSWDEWPVSE